MNIFINFVEKNKKLFRFYYVALRLSGWLLLTLGLCSTPITMVLFSTLGPAVMKLATLNIPLRSLESILFGILGLGIAQLIRYLIDDNCKPGFILKHGRKFLFAYILLILALMIIRSVVAINAIKYFHDSNAVNAKTIFFVTLGASIVLFAAKTLILIGLAQFLKRIIPVIEEHKSLV